MEKLCPFRIWREAATRPIPNGTGDLEAYWRVEFLPCLGEKCALAVAVPGFGTEKWERSDEGTPVRTEVRILEAPGYACAFAVMAERLVCLTTGTLVAERKED